MQSRRKFGTKALVILLVALLVIAPLSVMATPAPPVPAAANAPSVGITPDQLDAMALDPQSWRLSHDTRFPETTPYWDDYRSFIPHPIVNWNNIRENKPGYNRPVFPELPGGHEMPVRTLRSAFILVEFPDRPMISGLRQGAEMMGNPQVETGIYGLEGEERAQALQDFWREFINEYHPELNRGHNIAGAWLEYTAGLWEVDANFHGPYLLPAFQFQLGSWWNSATPIMARSPEALARFGNFTFGQQFAQWGAVHGSLGRNSIGNQAIDLAIADGVGFEEYDFVFLVVAGYCQSPTWQEMGPMMFESPYRCPEGNILSGPIEANITNNPAQFPINPARPVGHVVRSIADQERIYDPVTRQLIPGVTGYDFTGLAHINRILATVEADGFDMREAWPNFWMLNYTNLWKHHVTARNNYVISEFGAVRAGWEAAHLDELIAAWRTAHPNAWNYHANTAITDVQIRDNFFRPGILADIAEEMKYEFTPNPDIEAARALIATVTTIPYIPPANPTPANLNTARSNAVQPHLRNVVAEAGLDVTVHNAGATGIVNNNTSGGTFWIGVASGASAFADGNIPVEALNVQLTGLNFVPAARSAVQAFGSAAEELEEAPNYLIQDDEYEFSVHYDRLVDTRETLTISPEMQASTAALFAPVTAAPRARSAQVPTQQWLDFFEANDPATAQDRLLVKLHEARQSALDCTVNPWFQASNQRYIPWSSWYASANVWSSISTGASFMGRDGNIRSLPTATQGEGTAMAVYSHELGHAVHLPDNDNMVYSLTAAGLDGGNPRNAIQSLPVRAQLGPWNIMARGAHVGYYGGHARWNIPGIRGGSGGTGLIAGMRIGAGFTDLTTPRGPAPNAAVGPRNWLREDYENSLDVLYVDYNTFRAAPPVIGEVFGRNIPVNRGFTHADGTPLVGREAIVIQGTDFRDQTPHINSPVFGTTNALRWGNNLLGVNRSQPLTYQGNWLRDLPSHPSSGQNIIDPERWNYSIGGAPGIQLGGAVSLANHNIPFTNATLPRQSGFTIDVIDRVGHDSFSPDHGVLIARTSHTNVVGVGSMDNAGVFLIDAHPGNLGMVQFRNADGSPYMFMCDHHMQIATAAFRAGVHNNPYFYRETFPGRFLNEEDDGEWLEAMGLPADPRPGVAGHTVNEWQDVHNNFHFYVLARNNHMGAYGPFLSYEVAVRSTAPGAYVIGGELDLVAVGEPTLASVGNFSVQRFEITACEEATATDIVRIVLEGELAERVMAVTDGGYEYEAHTRDQNVVILNNLFAIAPGETIAFDVFIRAGVATSIADQLSVSVVSETNPDKYATVEVDFTPTGVGINGAPATLRRNQSVQLSPVAIPSFAALEDGVIWSSSNPAVATVNAQGVVTARVATGVVVITARTPDGQVVSSVTIRLSL